jgi:hypothetical protein
MKSSHYSGDQGASAGWPPTPEQMWEWRRRMLPPENELPAGVGLTVLLGRSDEAAAGITQIEAFTTGFRFTLAVRVREVRPGLARGGLSMLLSPHFRPDIEVPMEDRLLLGIEYPSGHRVSTLENTWMKGPGYAVDEQQLVLTPQGGGGGGENGVDHSYWVSPPASGRAGDLRPGVAGLRHTGVPDRSRRCGHPRRRRTQPTAVAAATDRGAAGATATAPPVHRMVRRPAGLTGPTRARPFSARAPESTPQG